MDNRGKQGFVAKDDSRVRVCRLLPGMELPDQRGDQFCLPDGGGYGNVFHVFVVVAEVVEMFES